MTPKEKAKQLVDTYSVLSIYNNIIFDNILVTQIREHIKNSAIIAANEALNADWFISDKEDFVKWDLYWVQVKQEIEKL